ncbi:hypothetical protein F889_00920 [Acinetobacter colistiniresistens]|uniref:Uncharacterized protein n=1 Tax=Acinetobacter colistiniresistens TaxID=280145 RepID=N9PP51_9GAMM|nr:MULTISPECIES: hypothetical protein [Acinetobacter]ENX15284.1 hypothetical protein F895_01830 [Acinetobacter sp. CIP 64.2]ENX35253.1 hypothetical protein F889_00920 [Acinetobacter colistiniresistens]EPG37995.1 hypothetical protein F907_01965 [Acinetobacter colistiniresistens]TVT75389.1 hypothetical protein FPV60_21535 [Acinetobacter colistiniresistens]UUM26420.1 hypothetical protein NQU59_12015 [Acinetobacter colistiniresistens]
MTHTLIFEQLTQLIENYSHEHSGRPQKILIGYKAYYDLMGNSSFATEVTESALNPNKRKYKKIKIKVTKDDYQLELE